MTLANSMSRVERAFMLAAACGVSSMASQILVNVWLFISGRQTITETGLKLPIKQRLLPHQIDLHRCSGHI